MVIFAVWLSFDCFWLLVHCWYSLDRPVTIGTPICFWRLVHCTNRQKQSKDSQNSKNDHRCTNRHMSTQSPPNTQSLRTRPKFSKTVMVSVGVTKLGCTELFFVEPGVKINGAYYRDLLLTQKLLPVIRHISGNEFVFQQDSAPAHRARAQTILSSYVERRAGLYFTRTVATEQSRS